MAAARDHRRFTSALITDCVHRIIDVMNDGYFDYFVRGYIGLRTKYCIFNLRGSDTQYVCDRTH